MLATSAISIGYSLKPFSFNGCAKKECTAWPPSCTIVMRSCICPAAFIKINGAPLSASGQLYPPGALPILLSRSRCFKAFIFVRHSPKNGRSFEKHSMDLLISSSLVLNGCKDGEPSGSTSKSHGRRVSKPSLAFFF